MERTADSTLLHIVRLRLLQDFPAQINACLDVLTEEQLWWRPNESANAAANLVIHLAASNRYYFAEILACRPIERDRDAEFSIRGGVSKDDVRARWSEAVRVATEVLDSLDPSRVMEATSRTGKETTFAQVLLHVSHHNAIHTGQLLWITKMLQPGTINDLGRRRR